jgi:uncharacterized protein (TIGR00299 family) protein
VAERTLTDIEAIIDKSGLTDRAKRFSRSVFREIAVAEGKVHGKPPEEVHFHEIGALDSIVDIVGVCVCLDLLDVDAVYASELHEGRGFVNTRHGRLPVPVPAVLEMLADSDIPFITEDIQSELITPTGIGLIKTFAKGFGPMPPMRIEKTGYGFGKRDVGRLNALRVMLGESVETPPAAKPTALPDSPDLARPSVSPVPEALSAHGPSAGRDEIVSLEANLDDMSAEALGYAMERLLAEGALDVFFTPIYMKKNRPATKLTVLVRPADAAALTDVVFRETTTLGVREARLVREVMGRRTERVELPLYGEVRVKVASRKDVERFAPEYEDCRAIAAEYGLALDQVYELARERYRSQNEERRAQRDSNQAHR